MALTKPQKQAKAQAIALENHAAWCLKEAAGIRRRALLPNSRLRITRKARPS